MLTPEETRALIHLAKIKVIWGKAESRPVQLDQGWTDRPGQEVTLKIETLQGWYEASAFIFQFMKNDGSWEQNYQPRVVQHLLDMREKIKNDVTKPAKLDLAIKAQ